ncbi:transcription factor A, mitochondrial [Fundulus heteroclitus]|uniref:transcription factor A, mitochondrial n=1 Tax=Fundulus heteroclitus TaxID=8078 RepID=UPI00165AEA65|nr:transcription factor A, mitochondrial [Fundulus heteroclitus]XP_035998297.1 transcription factor A, mitochondrial [Fundulus heteroclitus]
MAPYNLLTATASLVARSFSAFYTNTPARCTSIVYNAHIFPVKYLTSQTSGPPKRPLNGYMRYVLQQKPFVTSQNPEIKLVDVVRKIAQQWRMMSPEEKQPFQEASVQAMKQFKMDLEKYQSQLTPAQLQQQAVERRQRLAKRKAIRKKRELTILGKPKRPRTPFNIFMSEHFQEARGATTQAKMKSLLDDWRNLFSHQKQIYVQLAEDDKIRYKNEMKSWEDHMVDIGRVDLIREQTQPTKKKPPAVKKQAKKSSAKSVKKTSPKRKSKTSSKTKLSSSAKTVKAGSSKKA